MKSFWGFIQAAFRRLLGPRVMRRRGPRIGKVRNRKCWCGSGLKYKRCHWIKDYATGVIGHK